MKRRKIPYGGGILIAHGILQLAALVLLITSGAPWLAIIPLVYLGWTVYKWRDSVKFTRKMEDEEAAWRTELDDLTKEAEKRAEQDPNWR